MHVKLLLNSLAKWRALYVFAIIASLSFIGVNAFDNYAPTVSSDKDDYAPGEVAIITGYGWTQDQFVDIHFEETPAYHGEHQHDFHGVAVDAEGKWTIKYQIEERHLGVKFDVKVVGGQTGKVATTTFTDAGLRNVRITSNSISVASLCVGQKIEVTFDAVTQAVDGSPTGNFNQNNKFIAQLSNASGSFSSPVDIGELTNRAGNNLVIEAIIPNGTVLGSGYRIRVISTSPVTNEPNNGSNLTISAQPTIANAGTDKLNISGTATNLAGNNPSVGSGQWSIVSGTGGSLANPSHRNSQLSGISGNSYTLRWTITNGVCSSSDDVVVSFSSSTSTITEISNATTTYGNTSLDLNATISPNLGGGSVDFYVNGNKVGSGDVGTGGIASYTYNPSTLNASSVTVNHTVQAIFKGFGSFTTSTSANGTLTVNKATTSTVVTLAAGPFTYTGSAITPASITVTGPGLSLTPAATYSNNVNAGTASASYSYAGGDNYLPSSDRKDFAIGKAASVTTVSIAAGPFTYTGSAITPATVSVTGAGGLSLTPAAVYGDNTNAGTATASYSYAESANHLASSDSKTFIIGKAATTTVVTIAGAPFTYSGEAITPASVSVTGVGGLNMTPTATYANNTNAGTATASYAYAGGDNYLASEDSKTFSIGKAAATIVVTGYEGIYDGAAHGATGSATGVKGEALAGLNLGASFTDVPGGTASWEFTDATGNYSNAEGSAAIVINKAATTTVVTINGEPFTYTGAAQTPATVSVRGAGGLNLTPAATYADNVNAGTATASFTFAGDNNYATSSDSKNFTIGTRAVTIAAAAKSKTYGEADPALTYAITSGLLVGSDTFTGALTRDAGNDVGTYAIKQGTVALSNNYALSYTGADLTITKAALTVTANNANRLCGQSNAAFTGTIEGIKNGDNITATYTSAATAASAAGEYDIVPAILGAALGNYEVNLVNGLLTIGKVIVDANANSTPQAIKKTDTTISIKVTDSAGGVAAGVPVTLMFEDRAPVVSNTDASGIAIFNVGILGTNVYKIVATAGAGCDETTVYLPVYDPEGGFVTGGGWIDSPAGAYKADVALTGKANFGFVAKYKKGSTVPDGNTEFNFKAGNMNFNSSAYDDMRLVIAGAKANYRGVGQINGGGRYGFMVSAIDGEVNGGGGVDKFRIKIWDLNNNDAVVYDNNITNTDENAEPATAIQGSIVIHTPNIKGRTTAKVTTDSTPVATNLAQETQFYNYPNAFSDRTTIAFSVDKAENFSLEVYDLKGSLIKRVSTGLAEAGQVYEFELEGRNMAEGIYLARLTTASGARTLKMILKK